MPRRRLIHTRHEIAKDQTVEINQVHVSPHRRLVGCGRSFYSPNNTNPVSNLPASGIEKQHGTSQSHSARLYRSCVSSIFCFQYVKCTQTYKDEAASHLHFIRRIVQIYGRSYNALKIPREDQIRRRVNLFLVPSNSPPSSWIMMRWYSLPLAQPSQSTTTCCFTQIPAERRKGLELRPSHIHSTPLLPPPRSLTLSPSECFLAFREKLGGGKGTENPWKRRGFDLFRHAQLSNLTWERSRLLIDACARVEPGELVSKCRDAV